MDDNDIIIISAISAGALIVSCGFVVCIKKYICDLI